MNLRATPAVSIGVVYNRAQGTVVRVMNPDYEEELDFHPVAEDEYMLRVAKTQLGISHSPDGMTLADLHRVIEAMQRHKYSS